VTRVPSHVIVDTDVFSFIWQRQPIGQQYEAALKGNIPVLSFTTVAELHYGASCNNWGERKIKQLEAGIKAYVVAPYSPQLAKIWGTLKAQARKSGHPLGAGDHSNDLWIASTAVFYDAPLATHNRRHFEGLPGLRLVLPEPLQRPQWNTAP
jgi:tRNA(fMet)-specific endonuclease VapC